MEFLNYALNVRVIRMFTRKIFVCKNSYDLIAIFKRACMGCQLEWVVFEMDWRSLECASLGCN